MKITRTSMASGKVHTMDLDVTDEQIRNFNNGMHLQLAFPNLTPAEREFIYTGITSEEWDELFKDEEE